MGSYSSSAKNDIEIQKLCNEKGVKEVFTEDDVRKLESAYAKITSNGSFDVQIFAELHGIPSRSFAEKICKAIDADNNQNVEFDEYVKAIARLTKQNSMEKAQFLLDIYDDDKNGTISKEEFQDVMNYSLGPTSPVKLSSSVFEIVTDDMYNKLQEQNSDPNDEIPGVQFCNAVIKNPAISLCVTGDLSLIPNETK